MTVSDYVLAGILVSIVGWSFTNTLLFILKKHRISTAIIADVNYHLKGVKEAKDYINKFSDRNLIAGQIIDQAAYYTKEEYDIFKNMQKELFIYYGKKKLTKIIRFYKAFWELEVIIDGFMLDVRTWKKDRRTLTKDDVDFMLKRKDRIIKLSDLISKAEIKCINDLPDDYMGRVAPDTLVI